MDPSLLLLAELGVRAKSAEMRVQALEGVNADLTAKLAEANKKIEALTAKDKSQPEKGK